MTTTTMSRADLQITDAIQDICIVVMYHRDGFEIDASISKIGRANECLDFGSIECEDKK